MKERAVAAEFYDSTSTLFGGEPALEFVWKLADDRNRALIERLAKRDLYKRIFEARLGDIGEAGEYYAIRAEFLPEKRVEMASKIEKRILDSIAKRMADRSRVTVTSINEDEAKRRYDEVSHLNLPLVVVDFPVRGVSEEKNYPGEINDPARKYLASHVQAAKARRNLFLTVRKLQSEIASVRIFAAKELHELVVRYLEPKEIQQCVESVVHRLKIDE
jgi:hypothetical protein